MENSKVLEGEVVCNAPQELERIARGEPRQDTRFTSFKFVPERKAFKHKPPIPERFAAFNADNPGIYKALLHCAHEAKDAGAKKIGISLLYERVRWSTIINASGGKEDYKMPNEFRPYYARLIEANEPRFKGFFTTRR